MAAMELLCQMIGVNPKKYSKEEIFIVEAELFVRVCEEITEFFRRQHADYFQIMKFTSIMENAMLNTQLISLIIKDILSTKEYTLEGIACYTNIHIDVLQEFASGCNSDPSAASFRKIIELHRLVRKGLYKTLMKKIASDYFTAA